MRVVTGRKVALGEIGGLRRGRLGPKRARVIGFDSKMSRLCEDGGRRRRGGMSR